MLSVRNLNKIYKPKKGASVTALRDINLDIADRGLVFLLGKSGSGKSTLLNILGGLDTYSSGEIIIKGRSSASFSKSDFDSYRNTFLGFVFQEFNILDDYSVGKNIGLALELQKKKADKESIENILKAVDLEDFYMRRPNELSGGQLQRVSIARALVKNPDIILADEPTGSLDVNTGRQVFDVLQKLAQDKLIIVVSHDRENAELYADRIIELQDGNIINDRTRASIGQLQETTPIDFEGEKVIKFEAGHQLDQKDFISINEMLSGSQNDVYMSLDSNNNIEFKNKATVASTQFEATSDKNLHLKPYDPKDFSLVKSSLPLSDSFKMGVSGFKQNYVRLIFTILLSLITFTMLGFSITASTVNSRQIDINNFIQYGFKNVRVASVYNNGSYTGDYNAQALTDEQLENLTDIAGKNILRPIDYGFSASPTLNLNNYVDATSDTDLYYSMILKNSYKYLRVPFDPAKSNFKVLEGKMPVETAEDEIAINDWQASLFLKYGYKDINTGSITDINDYSDLIGLELGNAHIIGVLATDVDISMFDKFKGQDIGMLSDFATDGVKYTSLGYVYVGEDVDLKGADLEPEWSFNTPAIMNLTDINGQPIEGLKNDLTDNQKKVYKYTSVASANKSITGDIVPQSMNVDFEEHNLTLADDEVFIGRGLNYFKDAEGNSLEYDIVEEIFAKQPMKIRIESGDIVKEYKVKAIVRNYNGESGNDSPIYESSNFGVTFSHNESKKWRDTDSSVEEYKREVMLPLSSSQKIKDLYRYLDTTSVSDGNIGFYSLQLNTNISGIISVIDGTLATVTQVLMYIGIAFAVFSGFLLMNFIGASVANKKRYIGILRALGARGRDVFKIFFIEGLLIGATIAALSLIATAISSMIVNTFVTINILQIGWLTTSYLLGLTIFVVFVATVIPVYAVVRKKTIDAIKNR